MGPWDLGLRHFGVGKAREGATEKRVRVQELRAPEKQLGSHGAGEREARMDSEAAARRLEDAPLHPLLSEILLIGSFCLS